MFPAEFEYYRAGDVQEAIDLLGQHEDAKLLAGGHSLIPMMKLRLAQPTALIDIGRIKTLRGIDSSDGQIRIGALTTHAELAASDVLREQCGLLSEAAGKIADPQVRNLGTIAGNLVHADPASDLPAVILALGATIHLQGPGGNRQVAAADFFVDLLTTAIETQEIVTAIGVEPRSAGTGSCYLKVEHPASGYAICGAAALLTMSDQSCSTATLSFNGITATPLLAEAVGNALVGTETDDAAIADAIEQLSIEDGLGDVHASAAYRAQLAKTFGRRALATARDRASA